MKVVEQRLEDLTPYAENPRVITERAVDAVARSIEEFGFQQPLVVDTAGTIIVGHTRWRAARKLGLETVPCLAADLTPEQIKAYRIADNKTGELSDWDFTNLVSELDQLSDAMPSGFTKEEYEHLRPKLQAKAVTDADIKAAQWRLREKGLYREDTQKTRRVTVVCEACSGDFTIRI